MSQKDKSEKDAAPPTGEIRRVRHSDRGLEVTVRLRNENDRAIHYIGSVRTVRFDVGTKELVIGLSDEGRLLVPGGLRLEPDYQYIDPHSEAELALHVPSPIVSLAPSASADDPVAFQQQDLAEADQILVRIAWSDTPFYHDPRETDDDRFPSERWALGTVQFSHALSRPARETD